MNARYPQPLPRLTREGPTREETQIIGVELAITGPNGQETELEMFSCTHTLPAIGGPHCVDFRVTLHTSGGDITLGTRGNRVYGVGDYRQ